jgi:hypothetical protein
MSCFDQQYISLIFWFCNWMSAIGELDGVYFNVLLRDNSIKTVERVAYSSELVGKHVSYRMPVIGTHY